MNNPDYIPYRKDDFHDWCFHLMTKLASDYEKWGIPPPAYADLHTRYEAYNTAYHNTLGRETSTLAAIYQRNALKKDLVAVLRRFVKMFLRYNPAVTNSDLGALGLPVYSGKRHPAPVPTTIPHCHVSLPNPCQLRFDFYDPEKIGKRKPKGIHGCEMKWGIRDSEPASSDDLNHATFDTRSPIILTFDLPQRGRTVWFMLRWHNTRGEAGPWCVPKNAVIP